MQTDGYAIVNGVCIGEIPYFAALGLRGKRCLSPLR